MFKRGLTVSFSHLFNEEIPLDFALISIDEQKKFLLEMKTKCVSGIGKKDLILFCITLLNFDQRNSDYLVPETFIEFWFKTGELIFKNKILERLKWLSEIKETEVLPFNTTTSLSLLEYAIRNPLEYSTTKNRHDFEVDMLRVYTIETELLNLEEINIDNHISDSEADRNIQKLFIRTFAYNDYTNYDINTVYISQVTKAKYFVEYLKQDERFSKRLSLFLQENDIENVEIYVSSLLKLCKMVYNKEAGNDIKIKEEPISIEPIGNSKNKAISFLKTLSSDTENSFLQKDFIGIRNSPLYEESQNRYIVIFPLFLLEKTFKSFYWNIIKFNEPASEIKNPKSDIGLAFSEKCLTVKVLSTIFKSEKYFKSSGDSIRSSKNKNTEGEPDYYAREQNRVFLFESKDTSINSAFKSDDNKKLNYDEVEIELKKKFYQNEYGKPKAIVQLVNNCLKALRKPETHFDRDYDETKVLIYPILIVHDSVFNALGFNIILDKWFQEKLIFELERQNISRNPQRVFRLVVMDIDTLIGFSEYFHGGILDMKEMLFKYHLFCTNVPLTKEGVMQSASSFSKFIHEYVIAQNLPLIPPAGFTII